MNKPAAQVYVSIRRIGKLQANALIKKFFRQHALEPSKETLILFLEGLGVTHVSGAGPNIAVHRSDDSTTEKIAHGHKVITVGNIKLETKVLERLTQLGFTYTPSAERGDGTLEVTGSDIIFYLRLDFAQKKPELRVSNSAGDTQYLAVASLGARALVTRVLTSVTEFAKREYEEAAVYVDEAGDDWKLAQKEVERANKELLEKENVFAAVKRLHAASKK